MKHLLIVLVALFCMVGQVHDAMAANLRFLKDSVVARFDDVDWQMLQNAVTDALEQSADGASVTWRNDKSGHWGTVTPLNTLQQQGLKCRLVRFVNHTKDQTGSGTAKYCDTKTGWKVAH